MTKLTFLPHAEICPNGATIEAEPGTSICDAAQSAGIEIEHACEKSCACTTCHVILREGYASLAPAEEQEEDQIAAIIPTGPSDPADSWQLIVAEAANSSRNRLWIASPYFVPDEGVMTALQTAALRGVDVRILIPEKADHLLVWLSAFSYYEQSLPLGIRIFRYQKGFLHQKVMLIDERLASVGTANLDNRSFRLNFEISAFSNDRRFVSEVADMLREDFRNARETNMAELKEKPWWFSFAYRTARLLAPIQ